MKLTIIGGGGIRTPMFIESLINRQMMRIGQPLIDKVTLMDIQEKRLETILTMCKFIIKRLGSNLLLDTTTDLHKAVEDADFIVTTMRVGFEQGRVIDEKVALENGCIGQETVGPGGFAMAMRSIPEVLKVAKAAQELAPKAWIINFANPAGIVAQAVHDNGFDRVIGICDSADNFHNHLSKHLSINPKKLQTSVFGLNHLSCTLEVLNDGEDITAQCMRDKGVIKKHLAIFKTLDIFALEGLPNEYLYYYLYPRKAYKELKAEETTRGESIVKLNKKFFSTARRKQYRDDPGAMLALHKRTILSRHESYMNYAWENTDQGHRHMDMEEAEGEGYAGVALDFMYAVTGSKPTKIALNVPPGKPISGLSAHEVVEVSCMVNRKGIVPILPEKVPAMLAGLMRQVKSYETMTTQACRQKNRRLAQWALEANPLVGSAKKARAILDGYTKEHGGIFKELE